MKRLPAGASRWDGRGTAKDAEYPRSGHVAAVGSHSETVRGGLPAITTASPSFRPPALRTPRRSQTSRPRLRAGTGLALALLSIMLVIGAPAQADTQIVRVGVYENSPKVFTAGSGQPAGIFIDVIEDIARVEGWQLRYVRGSWAEGLERLERGEIDLMPDVALTETREAMYSFHKVPVLSSWDQVYAARDSGVHSILDLDGKSVAVLSESVQQETFTNLTEGYGLRVRIVPAPDYDTAFGMVADGRAVAVIANNYYGSMHFRSFGLESTAVLFNPCALFFAARRDADDALLETIDARLTEMKGDPQSAYHRSLHRWIGEDTQFSLPLWVKGLGLAVAAILLASLVGSTVLRRQVDARTRALAAQNAQVVAINKALHDSERKYRELVQNANSIILHIESDGTIAFLNEFGQQFFGYTEEELIGRHLVGTIVPESESTGRDMRPLLDGILANPAAYEHNINENVRRNGERVWIEWTNKAALDDQGRVVGILSIGANVTERIRAEEELHRLNAELEQKVAERTADLAAAKERAESADRLKSAFLATMSHELRTPLNSIIGFTGIMLQGLPGPLNEEQTKQLGMVQGSARHLLELINDVLDLSKIEAGQFQIEAEPFDVRAAVDKVTRLVAPMAEKKQLALTSEVSPDVGEMTGDRRRFEQILINILNNAVKFSEEGYVRLECGVDGDELVTRVSDTGIGIRPEDLGQLFNPFQQVDIGLTRNHEGSGLGLSICKKLLEIMGGSITVESEWGAGSTFTFKLPLA